MLSFKGDTSMVIDTKNMPAVLGTSHFFEDGKPISIRPGEFILASTSDIIIMPFDLVGRVEGKSSLGRIGLMVHSTAGYIDPGFSGQITLELSNVGRHPIYLYENMPIAQISFMKVSGKVERPYASKGLNSKYQNQFGPTESRYGKNYDIEQMEAC